MVLVVKIKKKGVLEGGFHAMYVGRLSAKDVGIFGTIGRRS
jgi:hypothetical protein